MNEFEKKDRQNSGIISTDIDRYLLAHDFEEKDDKLYKIYRTERIATKIEITDSKMTVHEWYRAGGGDIKYESEYYLAKNLDEFKQEISRFYEKYM